MLLVRQLHRHLWEQHWDLIYIFWLKRSKFVADLRQSTAPIMGASSSFFNLTFRSCGDPPTLGLLNGQGSAAPSQSNLADLMLP